MQVLMPALEARGRIEYTPPAPSFSPWSPVPVKLSTANVIFIFITDMGGEALTELVMSYDNRSAIPQNLLRSRVQRTIDAEWERLRFGTRISDVIPFFPMEPEGIREVLRAKLRAMAINSRAKGWAELLVDDDLVVHMSDPRMVRYNETLDGKRLFAKWGVNDVMTGTPV
jgi:hypothetical protein